MKLETKTVKSDKMLAVLPTAHPLAKQKNIKLKDIENKPYIMPKENNYSEPSAAFAVEGIKPNIEYIIHDDYAIMTMVEAGLGVSILAELVLRIND